MDMGPIPPPLFQKSGPVNVDPPEVVKAQALIDSLQQEMLAAELLLKEKQVATQKAVELLAFEAQKASAKKRAKQLAESKAATSCPSPTTVQKPVESAYSKFYTANG